MPVTTNKVGHPIVSNSPNAITGRARYKRMRQLGRCHWCCAAFDSPILAALCPGCARKSASAQRKLRLERRTTGLCQECGADASFKTRCPKCVNRRNNRQSRQPAWRAAEYAARRRERQRR